MKKFLIIILSLLFGFQLFGQSRIYSKIKYLDKFNDEIKIENIKTIVERTDSTFIVETKSKNPVIYYILNILDCAGDKDNIVNLVANVYGYQTCWCVVRSDMIDGYAETYFNASHRVIVSQYSHTYESEYFWIEDETNTKLGKDINRIIYIK